MSVWWSRIARALLAVLGALLMSGSTMSKPAPMMAAGVPQIYVAELGRIVRVSDDMTGAGLTALGTSGTGVNQFGVPEGISVDGMGRIYVADWSNRRIVRVNDMTGGVDSLGGDREQSVRQP